MNIKTWMLAVLGISKVLETDAVYTALPQSEINELLSMTNKARKHVSVFQPSATRMSYVTWDYALQSALQTFVTQTDPAWFFQHNQTKARYNGEVLMNYEPFSSEFPQHDFFFHDACQSKSTAVKRIFYYRAMAQQNCFNYNSCSTTINPHPGYINNYMSCNRNPIKLVSNTHCSWFWQYYPMIVNDNVKSIACMLTGHPGPNAAGYRPNHFFCYYGKARNEQQTTEQPYISGVACSDCPPSSRCVKGLCL